MPLYPIQNPLLPSFPQPDYIKKDKLQCVNVGFLYTVVRMSTWHSAAILPLPLHYWSKKALGTYTGMASSQRLSVKTFMFEPSISMIMIWP